MRIHTGEKPFQCSQCDMPLSERSKLVMHYRGHTGEKPYQCCRCHKSYSKSDSLLDHLKTHNREKPCQCNECERLIQIFYIRTNTYWHTLGIIHINAASVTRLFHSIGPLENIFWYTLERSQIHAVAVASLIHSIILYQLHTQCNNGCLTETKVEVKEEWMEGERSNCENKLSE